MPVRSPGLDLGHAVEALLRAARDHDIKILINFRAW